MFVMHRRTPEGLWKVPDESKEKLSPLDYDVFINPWITAQTDMREYAFEECGSYPSRAMVWRPIGVQVIYFDEEGNSKEDSLLNHRAWMYLHECDHLDGLNMFADDLVKQTAEIEPNLDESLWKEEMKSKELEEGQNVFT